MRPRDHPRVCGEHSPQDDKTGKQSGSSPRVRGTHGHPARVRRGRGIIPACAGNTRVLALRLREVRDHPRVCGEHSAGISASQNALGSSPRVRGTRVFGLKLGDPRGIIPACAGNTRSRYTFATARRGHPRVCGEHDEVTSETFAIWGSSPRVRGTLSTLSLSASILGIIPACAGNTPLPSGRRVGFEDHPRVCGEHGGWSFAQREGVGSSPRVRGTLVRPHELVRPGGIIPACAGNTARESARPRRPWDHPRVCGEHSVAIAGFGTFEGSSPRVRGTRPKKDDPHRLRGIIPACAGNTWKHEATFDRARDHPRVCGEHLLRY